MDTATIQKINTLAKEFLNQGIANDSGDAFDKAKCMIFGKKQVSAEMEEQFINELKFLSRRINELNDKINSVKDDMKCVVEEIVKLKSQKPQKAQKEAVIKKEFAKTEAKEPTEAEEPKEESKETQRELKEPHDVSIEKIFYYGKK